MSLKGSDLCAREIDGATPEEDAVGEGGYDETENEGADGSEAELARCESDASHEGGRALGLRESVTDGPSP